MTDKKPKCDDDEPGTADSGPNTPPPSPPPPPPPPSNDGPL